MGGERERLGMRAGFGVLVGPKHAAKTSAVAAAAHARAACGWAPRTAWGIGFDQDRLRSAGSAMSAAERAKLRKRKAGTAASGDADGIGSKPTRAITTSPSDWRDLTTRRDDLVLKHTLAIGQSFRWIETEEDSFLGVLGDRLLEMQQRGEVVRYRVVAAADAPSEANGEGAASVESALRNYFQLHLDLVEFTAHWRKCDERFDAVSGFYPGARLLRQDPLECLFSFICSSNNNIARIHGMVQSLCRLYGSLLGTVNGADFYTFPTLEQLKACSEDALRAHGFGYRAKFVAGTVRKLLERPEGGRQWLMGLREAPYKEAQEALMTLPGIGPKVAACVCLFSLDKYEAIPVDTHVWQIAVAFYRKDLQNKTLTPRIMGEVEDTFIARFGSHAGWAHNVLFISDLADFKKQMPEHLQTGRTPKKKKPKKEET